MTDLFAQGGLVFMSLLTLIFFGVIGAFAMSMKNKTYLPLMKQLGLLAFIVGILSQFVGLFQMLSALEEIGQVSAPLLAGGLKVSLIAPIYGLIIFTITTIITIALKGKISS